MPEFLPRRVRSQETCWPQAELGLPAEHVRHVFLDNGTPRARRKSSCARVSSPLPGGLHFGANSELRHFLREPFGGPLTAQQEAAIRLSSFGELKAPSTCPAAQPQHAVENVLPNVGPQKSDTSQNNVLEGLPERRKSTPYVDSPVPPPPGSRARVISASAVAAVKVPRSGKPVRRNSSGLRMRNSTAEIESLLEHADTLTSRVRQMKKDLHLQQTNSWLRLSIA